jgi:hypothetical protein
MKRNHPLTIGEIVFDVRTQFFGVIVELTEEKAVLDMNGKYNPKYVPNTIPMGWCEAEIIKMFDEEITEGELMWETEELNELYQIAWGVYDCREGNLVCYEHLEFEDKYPYYSPYLDENLFEFEVEKK